MSDDAWLRPLAVVFDTRSRGGSRTEGTRRPSNVVVTDSVALTSDVRTRPSTTDSVYRR